MAKKTQWTIATLAVLGLGVSAYLSYAYLAQVEVSCWEGSAACDAVKASRYAWLGPVPVPLLGLLAYLAILWLSAPALLPIALKPQAPLLLFGLATVGTMFSAYLTYLELFVIYAICSWCVASAIVMALIWALSVFNLATTGKGAS